MQELVESEREYLLCDQRGGGGVVLLPLLGPLPLHASILSITFHLSNPGMSGVMASLSSLPRCPREKPHMWLEMWGFSVACLCVCPWAPEERPAVYVSGWLY